MKVVVEIFTSHALARALGAGLVLYLYSVDQRLLALYSVEFANLQLIAFAVKFGFTQKVFRDSSRTLEAGLLTLTKFNTIFYCSACIAIISQLAFGFSVTALTVFALGYSSVRYAYLTAAGRPKIAIFFEFTLPIILIFLLLYFHVFEKITYILFFSYLPTLLASLVLLPKWRFIKASSIATSDLSSSAYFFFSSLTQQLNSYIIILLFNSYFSYEYVANVRLLQVLVTPLQLVNVTFAMVFQRLAKGDWQFNDLDYNKKYVLLATALTLILMISLHISKAYNFYSADYNILVPFFTYFIFLYLFRVCFFFSDTRLVIAKKEDLIFRFNVFASLFVCGAGFLFALTNKPTATYVTFNLAPLLLSVSCYLWIKGHEK